MMPAMPFSSSTWPDALVWHARWCINESCVADTWRVKRVPQHAALWWVVANLGESPMTVAFDVSLCPRCGEPLATASEIDEGLAECTTAEALLLREWLSEE